MHLFITCLCEVSEGHQTDRQTDRALQLQSFISVLEQQFL